MEKFTITVYSENQTGLLTRVVTVFTRRKLNIDTLTVSESSIEGIHRFTITVELDEENTRKIVAQLDKQIDVLKAFYYRSSEIIHQEVALYKVPTSAFTGEKTLEYFIRNFNARILEVASEYVVIEKTGHKEDTQLLLNELKSIGIFEFVRSGAVAIPKVMEPLNNYLKALKKVG